MQLQGRWALVTGAGKRIGRVIALELGARGANVVVHHHRSAAEAEAVAASLRSGGVQAITLRADLADAAQARRLASEAETRTGGIALLVNNASNYLRTPFDTITEADWDASLDVNLRAPFVLAWTLGRAMRDRGEGCIVNLTDWAGERPYRHFLPYCVSKAGLIALTKALARELAPAVRVNAVSPGPVLPPAELDADHLAAIVRATPLARLGSPEDVARAIRFLVEEGDYATGSVLHVDGGRSIA
jgi:NAD(P)-dependent dehydrogenase (short-subunit alcohol dehydrogenase family)